MIPREPTAHEQRREFLRTRLTAVWIVVWLMVVVAMTWNATASTGPEWAYMALMGASGLGIWWVTR